VLRLPTIDDWFKLSLQYRQYHKPSHTLLKDYGYMQIMSYLDASNASRILEFGHGFNAALFERYGGKRDMWGVDDYQGLAYFSTADRESWESAFGREVRAKAPNCTYRRGLLGPGSTANLPDGHFDVVCSVSVMEELPVEVLGDVLRHVARLLKPGGVMIGTHDLLLETETPVRLGEYGAALAGAGLDVGDVSTPMLIGKRTLLESPSAAMLWYQGHQPADRSFWGHWSTLWTVAHKRRIDREAAIPTTLVSWRN